MSEYRAKPGNLCMAEAVPFGQRFNYHADLPVKYMLHPTFFLPVRTHFRAGDSIRLVCVEADRVAEYADAIVVQITRESVEVRAEGAVHRIPAEKAEAPAPETSLPKPEGLHWKKGFGCFNVLNAEDKIIAEFPKKADAIAYIEEQTGKAYEAKEAA